LKMTINSQNTIIFLKILKMAFFQEKSNFLIKFLGIKFL